MNLIDELPPFYCNSIAKSIQDSLSIEVDIVNSVIHETLNQFFIDTATYGLDKWEKMLGIPKNNFDIQTRRENIKAKVRSRGTTNMSTLKNICEAYSYGTVDIIVDHANFSFTVDFVGINGVPKAFEELDKIIEEIKPCHLEHYYKFNYNTNEDVARYTHKQLSNYTYENIRNSIELRSGNKWLKNT